jgi:predicted adenylyl cyclase CyaB
MARNVEIKARLIDRTELTRRAAALADAGPFELTQDDTFFRCETGRLKLRVLSPGEAELIFYRRSDIAGPKESFYDLAPVDDADALRRVLDLACGTVGRVCKQRTLYLVGATRVHLDRVEGLGDFVELEVVLTDHQSTEQGQQIAHALMAELGIQPTELLSGAYLDLLQA